MFSLHSSLMRVLRVRPVFCPPSCGRRDGGWIIDVVSQKKKQQLKIISEVKYKIINATQKWKQKKIRFYSEKKSDLISFIAVFFFFLIYLRVNLILYFHMKLLHLHQTRERCWFLLFKCPVVDFPAGCWFLALNASCGPPVCAGFTGFTGSLWRSELISFTHSFIVFIRMNPWTVFMSLWFVIDPDWKLIGSDRVVWSGASRACFCLFKDTEWTRESLFHRVCERMNRQTVALMFTLKLLWTFLLTGAPRDSSAAGNSPRHTQRFLLRLWEFGGLKRRRRDTEQDVRLHLTCR